MTSRLTGLYLSNSITLACNLSSSALSMFYFFRGGGVNFLPDLAERYSSPDLLTFAMTGVAWLFVALCFNRPVSFVEGDAAVVPREALTCTFHFVPVLNFTFKSAAPLLLGLIVTFAPLPLSVSKKNITSLPEKPYSWVNWMSYFSIKLDLNKQLVMYVTFTILLVSWQALKNSTICLTLIWMFLFLENYR